MAETKALTDICDGIKNALSETLGLKTSESYKELSQSVPAEDCPKIQVYPQQGTSDRFSGTDRTTFGGMAQEGLLIHVDLYATRRSQLDEDMEATTKMIDAIRTEFRKQDKPPFFGTKMIKSFSWSWRRRVFRYGKALFMGARFELQLNVG